MKKPEYQFELKRVKVSDLLKWNKNPRKISAHDKAELRKSLEKFSLIDKPIVNQDMTLADGVELFDDIWMSLVIRRDKQKIIHYAGCYENAQTFTNKGGLQSYDRNEMSIRTINTMAKYFPSVEAGPRKGDESIVDINLKNLDMS